VKVVVDIFTFKNNMFTLKRKTWFRY